MKDTWDLSVLYTGLDDPKYEADIQAWQDVLGKLHDEVADAAVPCSVEKAEKLLKLMESSASLSADLVNFVSLSQSVDTANGELMAQLNRLMRIYADSAADTTGATRLLGSIEDIDAACAESEMISTYRFAVEDAKKQLKHLLTGPEEALIAAMDTTGGGAWGNLQSFLTSNVKADYRDQQLTLSEVRALAYSADASERKDAYEAELKCYPKIQDSVAFALNNIKNQVSFLSKKRGYESVLDMTLEQSRMEKRTLDAMLSAIKEYLPAFRRYLRAKAEYLGYKNGLPWYEMFAPMGKSETKYTVEESRKCLVDVFGKLAPDMAGLMARAFDEEWIDFFPREGKQGGAFCAALSAQKQSRVLTNYDYTFGSVDTLAHELGHAYHDMQVENNAVLNRDYTMPVAETASTFNELHLNEQMLSAVPEEERIGLLDSLLRETTQCIVDIYSRFLFEKAVIERAESEFLMADDLNALMLECQKASYGDGLDENALCSGMWICKSHYYSSGISFYNFPYAFGNLFAQGLYALFLERGEAFMADYRNMLRLTPVHSMEENGSMLGIDLGDTEFWKKSLAHVEKQIDEFCALCGKE